MQAPTDRIYAFDHLKTTIMLLVIFLHSILSYTVADQGLVWPLKDPNSTSMLFDILLDYLFSVCMPIFFVMSGFMTGMLFTIKGGKEMIKNRLNRIFLPFLAGLLILIPITAIAYNAFKLSSSGISSPSLLEWEKYEDQLKWGTFRLLHLWFLYYLILFCVVGNIIATVLKNNLPKIACGVNDMFSFVYRLNSAPLLFSTGTFLLFCVQGQNLVGTPMTFPVNIAMFIGYFVFFGFGWMLYYQRKYFSQLKDRVKPLFIIGLVFFIAKIYVLAVWGETGFTKVILAAISAVIIWVSIFAYTGLYLNYFNNYSPLGRYLSDASYWVYLVHLPLVIFLQGAFINSGLNVNLKVFLVVSITFFTTILAYNFLVRDTFIGKFLDGKKYKKGLPAK